MSRLVVVSNRVADLKKSSQSGGLAVAVGDALKAKGGLWFGWDGNVIGNDCTPQIYTEEIDSVTLVKTPLKEDDYNQYYLGFSNNELWPVFHYRLDLADFETGFVNGYRRVNQHFAESLAPLLRSDDFIWVHDYHLIPLAAELRNRHVGQTMGFFLHIPFPPPEILSATPEHEWLVRSLASYDVIGFQTSTDLTNFHRYLVEEEKGEIFTDGLVRAYGRTIRVGVFPIGIDVEAFAEMARTEEAEKQIELLRRRTIARAHIIGVDRLDYTKGLPERVKAFGRLLEYYPENIKAVTLMQVAQPTREDLEAYTNIRKELEGLSGAINGNFGDFDWTPVRYIHRSVPRNVLAAIFRASLVGLVTPLRDGMNLVAKEYIAAQDHENPGVLILSKFAGAAEALQEALIVNPYDIDEVTEALQRAINMSLEERRERHSELFRRVKIHDAKSWHDSFIAAMERSRYGAVA